MHLYLQSLLVSTHSHECNQADLKKLSLGVSAVTDAAYLDNVDEIERLQRLMANVEGRRLVTLREFDRYRASTSRSDQRALATVVSDAG